MITLHDGNNVFRRIASNSMNPFRDLFDLSSTPGTIWVWDGAKGNQKRRDMWSDYKSRRPVLADSMVHALRQAKEVVSLTDAYQIRLDEYEADDVIAALAKIFSDKGQKVFVNSTDYDLKQLELLPGVTAGATSKDDVPLASIATYKTWVGDPSDCIPGIKGFGAKTWKDHQRVLPALNTMIENAHDECWDEALCENSLSSKAIVNRLNVGEWRNLSVFHRCVSFLPLCPDLVTGSLVKGTYSPDAMKAFSERWLLPVD